MFVTMRVCYEYLNIKMDVFISLERNSKYAFKDKTSPPHK